MLFMFRNIVVIRDMHKSLFNGDLIVKIKTIVFEASCDFYT